jgi:hypothetical protein
MVIITFFSFCIKSIFTQGFTTLFLISTSFALFNILIKTNEAKDINIKVNSSYVVRTTTSIKHKKVEHTAKIGNDTKVIESIKSKDEEWESF